MITDARLLRTSGHATSEVSVHGNLLHNAQREVQVQSCVCVCSLRVHVNVFCQRFQRDVDEI